MTTEQVKWYKRKYENLAEHCKQGANKVKDKTAKESLIDCYVMASDIVDICELAMGQLNEREIRVRRGTY